MLSPIEKLKVAILHLNRDWNHCFYINVGSAPSEYGSSRN